MLSRTVPSPSEIQLTQPSTPVFSLLGIQISKMEFRLHRAETPGPHCTPCHPVGQVAGFRTVTTGNGQQERTKKRRRALDQVPSERERILRVCLHPSREAWSRLGPGHCQPAPQGGAASFSTKVVKKVLCAKTEGATHQILFLWPLL